jgi:hypothetical protein
MARKVIHVALNGVTGRMGYRQQRFPAWTSPVRAQSHSFDSWRAKPEPTIFGIGLGWGGIGTWRMKSIAFLMSWD